MVVWVALNQWVGILKCCMTRRGMMLNADPESTWMRLTSNDLIYNVKYKGLSYFFLTYMSSEVKVMKGACCERGGSLLHLPSGVQSEFGPWKLQHWLKLLSELPLLTWAVSRAHKGWSWLGYWSVEPKYQSGKVLKILPLYPSEGLWHIEAPFTSPWVTLWIAWLALGWV